MNQETSNVDESEMIETTITNYIREKFNYTEQELSELTIQNKMYLVGTKSQEKWEEFKLGLRAAGYII